ncbi:MAG: hypothetical protein K6G90_04355 [Clostridia bacterium]|nr:hypothetical protein [Clostridia bacterium]
MTSSILKSMFKNKILAAIVFLISGVIMVIPAAADEISVWIARAVALACIAGALGGIVLFVMGEKSTIEMTALIISIAIGVLGAFFVVRPELLIEFCNIIFGLVIIMVGVISFYQATSVRINKILSVLSALVVIALGFVIILNLKHDYIIKIIGISLIVSALGEALDALLIRKLDAYIDELDTQANAVYVESSAYDYGPDA